MRAVAEGERGPRTDIMLRPARPADTPLIPAIVLAQRQVGWRWEMGVARGYVVALSIWVLGAGCQNVPRDSATGQFAGPSNAGSFAAGRGGSGAARTIHFAEVARSPDARTTGPIKPRTFEEIPRTAPAGAAAGS